jgi:hypothetical protein
VQSDTIDMSLQDNLLLPAGTHAQAAQQELSHFRLLRAHRQQIAYITNQTWSVKASDGHVRASPVLR